MPTQDHIGFTNAVEGDAFVEESKNGGLTGCRAVDQDATLVYLTAPLNSPGNDPCFLCELLEGFQETFSLQFVRVVAQRLLIEAAATVDRIERAYACFIADVVWTASSGRVLGEPSV